jgi:hypothetical protein
VIGKVYGAGVMKGERWNGSSAGVLTRRKQFGKVSFNLIGFIDRQMLAEQQDLNLNPVAVGTLRSVVSRYKCPQQHRGKNRVYAASSQSSSSSRRISS